MKRTLFLLCLQLFGLPLLADAVWEPLPKTFYKDESKHPETYIEGIVYDEIRHVTVLYSRLLDADKSIPRLVLYADGKPVDKIDTEVGDSLTLTFHLNLPYRKGGHVLRLAGESVELGQDVLPICIWGIFINEEVVRVVDIYYFDNPKFAGLRHTISAYESETYDGWLAHRIFTPGAWEPFCLPLPPDRVYTHEDDGTEVDLLPSTYQHPDGHYWIRFFREPCLEQQVGSNWCVPDVLTLPEAGVGYILMLPDDLWWVGREICFEGRFVHGGGLEALSDEYSETSARADVPIRAFIYLPNTTFTMQTVGEGWLPNVVETRGRYFDNHYDSYTLHPMECHLIGGSATTGIARIGTRNITTDLNESSSSSTSKFLRNGHLVIIRDGHSYDLLGRPY